MATAAADAPDTAVAAAAGAGAGADVTDGGDGGADDDDSEDVWYYADESGAPQVQPVCGLPCCCVQAVFLSRRVHTLWLE